jgi:hypothetical protein
MAGVKGRSGTTTKKDRIKRIKKISDIVNLSIDIIGEYLQSPDITLEKKAEMARHFAVKSMPNKVEGDIGIGALINAIHKTP